MLAMRLRQLGLTVMRSPDATHALVGVQRVRPSLVILDVGMPGGNGLAVAEMLASDEEFRSLPVIIHTGRDDELTRIRCAGPCQFYVKKGPDAWSQIHSIVCRELGLNEPAGDDNGATAQDSQPAPVEQSACDEPSPQDLEAALAPTSVDVYFSDAAHASPSAAPSRQPTVLCIDDDPDISKALKIRLEVYGVNVLRAFNGMQGYWTAVGERPDVIVCDMCMSEGDGNYIVSRLKQHPLTENVPVIILTGQGNPALKRTMLSLGADAYLSKPPNFDDLLGALRMHLDLPEQPAVRAAIA
jgi:DNA-binding response OmpR family regulator